MRPRQSARIVTTNVEESAEVEVADSVPVKAKGRIICNVNRECMFRIELPMGVKPAKRNGAGSRKSRQDRSEAEIKKDGR